MDKRKRYSTVDLFCGCGGLTQGFRQAGFQTLFAADHFDAATVTFARNLGENCNSLEINEQIELPHADVIVGGPPCQGFSSAGPRRENDHRNTLVSVFAKVVARERPKAFVFENVEGFLTADRGTRVFELLRPLVDAGYRIHLRKINAANYGVSQHRKRVIAVGGLGWTPTFAAPTHRAIGAPGSLNAGTGLPSTPSLEETLAGLPAIDAQPPGSLQGHFSKPLSGLDARRVAMLEQGQTMKDLPEELWHPSFARRANRRVADGTPTEKRGGAPSGLKRLIADQPSKAITTGATSEFVHPTEDRNLTIRECARIQSFPDDFIFTGTQGQQLLQIANAVPPLLAKAIGQALANDLDRQAECSDPPQPGALLSFVPTLSNGMSPILQKVTAQVESEFMGLFEFAGES